MVVCFSHLSTYSRNNPFSHIPHTIVLEEHKSPKIPTKLSDGNKFCICIKTEIYFNCLKIKFCNKWCVVAFSSHNYIKFNKKPCRAFQIFVTNFIYFATTFLLTLLWRYFYRHKSFNILGCDY
jgi:hypothetical protein